MTDNNNNNLCNGLVNAIYNTIKLNNEIELWNNPLKLFHFIEILYKQLVYKTIINAPKHECSYDTCNPRIVQVIIIKKVSMNDAFTQSITNLRDNAHHKRKQLYLAASEAEAAKLEDKEDELDFLSKYEVIFPILQPVRHKQFEGEIDKAAKEARVRNIAYVYACSITGNIHACGPYNCLLKPTKCKGSGLQVCPLTQNVMGSELDGGMEWYKAREFVEELTPQAVKAANIQKALTGTSHERDQREVQLELARHVVSTLFLSEIRQKYEVDAILETYQKTLLELPNLFRKQKCSDKLNRVLLFSTRAHLQVFRSKPRNLYFSRFPVNPAIKSYVKKRLVAINRIHSDEKYGSGSTSHTKHAESREMFYQMRQGILRKWYVDPTKETDWETFLNTTVDYLAELLVELWRRLVQYENLPAHRRLKNLGSFKNRIVPLIYMCKDGLSIENPLSHNDKITVIPKLDIARFLPPTGKLAEYSETMMFTVKNISFTDAFNDIKHFFTEIINK